MKNIERQRSLEKSRQAKDVECGQEIYCKFCQHEKETPCAKAYNRFIRAKSYRTTTERERYSRGDF